MAKKKKILYPVVFMVIVTAIYTLALALINEASIDRIKALEKANTEKAILYAFNLPVEGTPEVISEQFKTAIHYVPKSDTATDYYVYKANGDVKGYAFKYSGRGLWGSITGYIALNNDFTEIMGVEFISHSETPGLGGRIDELWFKEQFRNLSIESDDAIQFKPTMDATLDGITGATLTTTSVRDILNAFVKDIKLEAKEGNIHE